MNATLLPRPFLALGLCSLAAAQAPKPPVLAVEDVLPVSTYAAARFGGLSACGEAAGSLPMSVIVDTFLQKLPPETRQQHLEQGLEMAAAEVRSVLQQVGLDPNDVRTVLQRPMVMAMGRMTLEGMGPSVALVIDAGPGAAAIGRVFAALEALGAQFRVITGSEAVTIDGLAVRHLRSADGPPVFTATVGGFFVLTNSRGYLRDIAAVANGKQQKLASGSALYDLQRQLPQQALASLFVNTRSVCAMFDAHLPYEAAEYADALGIGRLDAIYAGTTATENGGCDLVHVGLHGSEKGLLKAAESKPADLGFASVCSKNTVVFGAFSFDVPAFLDAFDHVLTMLPEEAEREIRRELLQELESGLRDVGSSPEHANTLLRAFGNQVGFAISLEKGAIPKPEALVRIAVRDAAKVAPLLQQLEALVTGEAGLEWKGRKVGEQEIRFCNIDLEEQFKLSPCYTLLPDALLIGSDVAGLVRALRQADKPEESFASQPDFEAMKKGTEGAVSVLHLRLFRAAELGWRTVEQLAYPQLDAHREEVGFGSDALPDAEAMAKALGTSTFAEYVDAKGYTMKSQGTLSFGSLFAAGGALADEVLKRCSAKVY